MSSEDDSSVSTETEDMASGNEELEHDNSEMSEQNRPDEMEVVVFPDNFEECEQEVEEESCNEHSEENARIATTKDSTPKSIHNLKLPPADSSLDENTLIENISSNIAINETALINEEITPESVKVKHPGVFQESSDSNDKKEEESAERKEDIGYEKSKELLDSLPIIEKFKNVSRSNSEIGDGFGSDRDSGTIRVTRNSKKRKEEPRKPLQSNKPSAPPKSSKRGGLSTRSSKTKGRRGLLKSEPVKSHQETPTIVTSDKIYYKGLFFHKGDIVSVSNVGPGDIYYAQIRGFMSNEYAEKFAVITWLLPTTGSPPPNEGFHPATYVIGPEEDFTRHMEVFTFVMHAPDDYFFNRNAPYRTQVLQPSRSNFTSVRLGPRLRKTVDDKDIYVGCY